MKMKYIVVSANVFGIKEQMIMFSKSVSHLDVVVSAGFVEFHDNYYGCYGESESLKLKSRAKDDRLLKFEEIIK